MAHEIHSPSPASAGNLRGFSLGFERVVLGNMPARGWAGHHLHGINYLRQNINCREARASNPPVFRSTES